MAVSIAGAMMEARPMTVNETFVLETPRLILRRLTLDDLDALARLYADKEIRQYFPDGSDGTLTYAETKEALTGFYIMECADLDEAVAVAAKIPAAWDGAGTLNGPRTRFSTSATAGGQ